MKMYKDEKTQGFQGMILFVEISANVKRFEIPHKKLKLKTVNGNKKF